MTQVATTELGTFIECHVQPRLLEREGLPHGQRYADILTGDAGESINRLLDMMEHVDHAHELTHCPDTERQRRAVTRECIELVCCAYEYHRWYGEVEP